MIPAMLIIKPSMPIAHISKQVSLKQQEASDTERLMTLSNESVIINPDDKEKESIPFL